uniref:RING-type E3 ubiquitin transferase n=1 Tax=Davidia involucrata TaxID=16924 RepID=A0A5B7BBH0_DAVIN
MSPSPSSPPTIEPPHWNPWVIASVGTVCTIFLLFSYYRILERHCCSFRGMTFSRHRRQRQLLNENNPDDPSLQFQSQGLDSYILHSLPITQFKKKKKEEELRQSNTDCAVCLGEFEESEWLRHLPNCSHAFHVSCIDTWFQNHSNCPLCRSHIYDLAMHHEYSVSMYTLLETSRRED